ncbi:serine/threonine protein kinase [Rhodococcus erythropolis]|nr:serine/threonine protein kinase [Rhodococcus erythropolis]MCW2425463.1 serine/threonine protein kinase [Rhodococcus erythropolis]
MQSGSAVFHSCRSFSGIGAPTYTAPEVLGGDPPSPAADVYGLGATLFSALTGYAAFERRSGEQVVAQFLRITTQRCRICVSTGSRTMCPR